MPEFPPTSRWVLLGATALLAACDFPSSAPILDTRWALPAEETSIDISELLPDGIVVAPGGDLFLVEALTVQFEQSLGDVCPVCGAFNGQTVPKPPFSSSFSEAVDLPEDVAAGTLVSGLARIEISNGFSFDPLNPGGATGSIEVTLHSGGSNGPVIGSAELVGGSDTFPPGTTQEVEIELDPATVTGITAVITIVSPSGDPVLIDVSESLSVDAAAENLLASQALLVVAGTEVTIDPVDLDVADLDDSFVERIQEGSLELRVDNAFGVTVHIDLVVEGGGIQPITKSVTIPGGASTQIVSFTGPELQSFFGIEGVQLTGSGAVGASEPPMVARPSQKANIEGHLSIILRIGS